MSVGRGHNVPDDLGPSGGLLEEERIGLVVVDGGGGRWRGR